MRKFYQLSTTGEAADLYIFGDITSDPHDGSDVSASGLVSELAGLGPVTSLTVHISSYGGEVSEGIAIYNALSALTAEVTTVCEGFACSIASVIFMAGTRRVMRDASLLMIHQASAGGFGTADDMRDLADTLDTVTELSRGIYLAKTGIDPTRLDELMSTDTWISPSDALAMGFATEVTTEQGADSPTQSARQAVCESLTRPESVQMLDAELGDALTRVAALLRADGFEGSDDDREPDEPTPEEPTPDDPPEGQDEQDETGEAASEMAAAFFMALSRR